MSKNKFLKFLDKAMPYSINTSKMGGDLIKLNTPLGGVFS